MKLRIGYVWPTTEALGPGIRYAIWVQGCNKRCFRCASPNLQPEEGGHWTDSQELADAICQTSDINGISISGGEPLLQAEALTELLCEVRRQRPELTVILFTGYKLEQIRTEAGQELLKYVDLLIDGEYIDELNQDNIGLRGSSNQRQHFLTDRLRPYEKEITQGGRRREMHMMSPYEMLTIGIAPRRMPPINNK